MTTYSRASLARLAALADAVDVAEGMRAFTDATSDAWARPGELVDRARQLAELARAVLTHTVIHERLKGTSWEAIGWGLGDISKQAAQARYGDAERDFRRRALLAWLEPDVATRHLGSSVGEVPGTVEMLTEWWQAHRQPNEPDKADPVAAALAPLGAPEASAMAIEAAGLLNGDDRPADPHTRRVLEIGLARRKVELYERLAAELPDDVQTLEVLAGARARLAELTDSSRPPATQS
ncbi:hypothetical protein AB0J63_38775 [Streptosporangium canum]|uniref:hypothetical protein n=1 Tax=Streptosporangium canum TaxID=324952 RepID=UPI003422550F